MLSRFAIGVVLALALNAPAFADLHDTLHTEARQVTPADPVNPVFGMASDMLMRTMFPEGPTDATYWVSDKGTRVELIKGNVLAPAGAVLLNLVNVGVLVLNPKEHTYLETERSRDHSDNPHSNVSVEPASGGRSHRRVRHDSRGPR